MARQQKPDLILLDMRMPVLDGFETAGLLRADPGLRSIPVVGVTASVQESELARVSGICEGLLRKPLRRSELIQITMAFLPHTVRASATPEAAPGKVAPGELALRATALPRELVEAMLQAADLADWSALQRLLEEVGQHDASLAELLGRPMARFDYETLKACLVPTEDADA